MSNTLGTGRSPQLPSVAAALRDPAAAATQAERLGTVDIVRGLAMIFMLLNHATWHVPGITFRVNYGWDMPVPLLIEYSPLTWVGLLQGTPLFFIMTGFAAALFEGGRRRRGWADAQITRFLLVRGGVLIALDWLVLPWQVWPQPGYEPNAYNVLTCIGICLWLLAFLRRLPLLYLLLLTLAITVGTQALYKMVTPPQDVNLLRMVFLYMGPGDPVTFGFPVLPWLAVILLGYATMRCLSANPALFPRVTLGAAAAAWLVWAAVSHFRQFGVLFPSHPLLMTKHPPSLAYLAFYIGATYLLLYLLNAAQPAQGRFPLKHIALLGQTALAFYVLHFYAIDIFSALLQGSPLPAFVEVLLITALALVLLYQVCTRYRRLRKAHPDSLLRYL